MERTTSFGYWLRRRRKALDLTQDELARQVGCAVGTIKKLEGDERRPSKQLAERLADLLKLLPEERPAFLKAARAELAADQLDIAAQPVEMSATALTPAGPLPTGTVTFLFTDIEDSTRLWSERPEAMRTALARHDAILRHAIEAHGGQVVKTVGDAFHAVFATAADAFSAALAAQRALQTESWVELASVDRPQSKISVRMALHTGTAELRDGDYYGHALNRAARILSAGHGGQVLFSAATWELLRDHLPADVELRDLGAHWLKGLPRPEEIYQLVAPDLPANFPPLVTLDRPTTNLPQQATAFIGREREVAEVVDLLRRADVRLLTLTGPGGTGKTRLALQTAAELLVSDSPPLLPQRERGPLSHGAWFVNLAPISDPDLVASTIAQALGVREVGGQPLLDSLKSYLHAKHLLLLLDNFEQVVDAAPLVGELLATAPDLKVLVTSRMPLRLFGEREVAVPPLGLPPAFERSNVQTLTQYEAVRLFIERAQAVKADFAVTNENAPAVAEICYRLDGLPLAIELAAARAKLFPPQALLHRLDQRLKFLTGGARDLPARQQTIGNTIDWSYNLLEEDEKTLFAWMGIFVGGCTIEAAEAVCSADGNLPMDVVDGIPALVDKSLLRQQEGIDNEPRFMMLETIREYALERLEASRDTMALQRRHAEYFLALAEAADRGIIGPDERHWLDCMEAEHDNLRAAMIWSLASGDPEVGARIIIASQRFWEARGYSLEGAGWIERALALGTTISAAMHSQLLARWAGHKVYVGDLGQAAKLGEESLALARASGDKGTIGRVLLSLAWVVRHMKDYARAVTLVEESLTLCREVGDMGSWLDGLRGRAILAVLQDDIHGGSAITDEIMELCQRLGQPSGIADRYNTLGERARFQENYAGAATLYEQSLAIYRTLGYHKGEPMFYPLFNLGFVYLRQGEIFRAQACFREGLVIAQETQSNPIFLALGIAGMAGVFIAPPALPESARRAVRLLGTALLQWERTGNTPAPTDRADFEWLVSTTRAQLGEEAFAAAWEAGRAMSLEQAIAEALDQ